MPNPLTKAAWKRNSFHICRNNLESLSLCLVNRGPFSDTATSAEVPRPPFHTGMKKAPKVQQLLLTAFTGPGKPPTCKCTWRITNIYGCNWQNETGAPKDWWQASSSFCKQLIQHANGLNKTKHSSRRLISKSNTESRCDMKKQHSPGPLRILTSQRKCKPEQKNSPRL